MVSSLRQPVHIMVWCPVRVAIVVGAVFFLGLARTGAVMTPPACQAPPVAPILAKPAAFVSPAAECPEWVNISSRNLKLPRAPRHRGERPTSGVEEVAAVTSNTFLAVLDSDSHEPFVIAALQVCPLAGHPVFLLRPPSLLAG